MTKNLKASHREEIPDYGAIKIDESKGILA